MTAAILTRDSAFRRWLAARPGLWLEVGALDDACSLLALMVERRRLALPPIAALRVPRAARRRHRAVPAERREADANSVSGGHL
ncbi:hypothetical protein KZX46_03190 (plasmid) [Polymorphobacter sp. PAMC 29334]|uniref:hypothetical protein n=1 Tax=Polymorphobacter sp. PAMC 29334 TaxID=2862331 RepID=UPI001C754FEA|nr:hypothetical protein [Polymorphobacter sp. PAMC 29334]QYE33140.1 hypothetical protein KZX46_03190 [Polymorphobacter sp. PAMC 29334]